MSNVINFNSKRSDVDYEIGVAICLECGDNMKTLVERGADYRTLECKKCKKSNSIFLKAEYIYDSYDTFELNNERR